MADLKGIKKGDKVILRMFTGAFVGAKEVVKADKSSITVETKKGAIKFSIKTGKQIDPEPKNERFANFIEEYDEDVVKAEEKKRAKNLKKAAKKRAEEKAAKAAEAEAEEDEELEEEVEESEAEELEDEEPEEEPAPKPKKKVAKKKVAKKKAAVEEME